MGTGSASFQTTQVHNAHQVCLLTFPFPLTKLPPLCQPALLCYVVSKLQQVTPLPCKQLTSSDASPQSSKKLQRCSARMHFPFLQRNSFFSWLQLLGLVVGESVRFQREQQKAKRTCCEIKILSQYPYLPPKTPRSRTLN